MNNEELNTALYEKMSNEQNKFRDWLLEQSPQDILDCAYRYVIQEDILLSMEDNNLSDEQAKMLIESKNPLYDVYMAFENISSTVHMESIWDCIESHADSLIDLQKEKDCYPLYRESAIYAREHGELDKYSASRKANIACKEAIENAIHENYRDNRLDTACVRAVIERFGIDRVEYVLANTVQYKDWDERFSRSNREWAKTIPVVTDRNDIIGDRRTAFVVDTHTGLTDLFVSAFRSEQQKMREAPARMSIYDQLRQPLPPRSSPPKGKTGMER